MSAAQSSWGAVGAPVRPAAAVAVVAAVVALCLGGQGLLVPAGPSVALFRVVGALISLTAVGVLLRIDGPALAARTLVVVAIAGALTGLATLPLSPVQLSDRPPGAGRLAPGAEATDESGTGVVGLDRADGPAGAPDGSQTGNGGSLVLPEGSTVVLEGGNVVLRPPQGPPVVLGRAVTGPAAPSGAVPAAGQHPHVVVTDGGVARSDGGAIGGDTALGGATLRGSGASVVVGDGVLLEVPEPIPVEPAELPGPLSDGADALLAVLLVCFALLAFAPPVVRVAERATAPRTDPEPPPVSPAGDASQVEEGLADVLRAMLADPDPRTAVIGAYARLLSALDEVGHGRRAEETPHEHLWRTLGPLGVRRAPVHRLAELFVLARFTPHPVTDAHRDAAIAALADAVADLRLSPRDVAEVASTVGAPS